MMFYLMFHVKTFYPISKYAHVSYFIEHFSIYDVPPTLYIYRSGYRAIQKEVGW